MSKLVHDADFKKIIISSYTVEVIHLKQDYLGVFEGALSNGEDENLPLLTL